MPYNQKTNIPIPVLPKLFLIALEDDQKVARIRIDDMPNDQFFKTIKCQKLMGRTCEFELEEIK